MPTLMKIFKTEAEKLVDVAPYWRGCTEKVQRTPGQGWTCGIPAGAADLAERVGGDIAPPRPIFTPDPDYTPVARRLRFQGTTILWVVIDEKGRPSDVVIVRPLGLGLDDKAVKAVERWKFKPATKNGVPVTVQVNIEVNFRLYR